MQANISEYLINNYKKLNFFNKKQAINNIKNKNFYFLHNKMLELVANKFRNRDIKEICKIHLERIKKTQSSDLSDNTLKYLTCNFLGFSDSLVDGIFLDPGHFTAISLVNENNFNLESLLNHIKNNSRECVSIGEEDHQIFSKNI